MSRNKLSNSQWSRIEGMLPGKIGNPIKFALTRGQDSEVKPVKTLINDLEADYVLADKGYNADEIIQMIEQGCCCYPSKKNRKQLRNFDKVFI